MYIHIDVYIYIYIYMYSELMAEPKAFFPDPGRP